MLPDKYVRTSCMMSRFPLLDKKVRQSLPFIDEPSNMRARGYVISTATAVNSILCKCFLIRLWLTISRIIMEYNYLFFTHFPLSADHAIVPNVSSEHKKPNLPPSNQFCRPRILFNLTVCFLRQKMLLIFSSTYF